MKPDAINIEKLAQQKSDENWDFRTYLKMQDNITDKDLDELVFQITRRIWKTIDCKACGRCCRDLRPGVTEAEQQRLAAILNMSADEFCNRYLEYDPDNADEPPWRLKDSPCPFLQGNKCLLYEDRPAQCREYPYLYKPDFSFRTMAMIERTYTCPLVYQVMEEMKASLPFRRFK